MCGTKSAVSAQGYDGDGKVFFDQAAEEKPRPTGEASIQNLAARGLGFTNVGMLNAKRD